MAEETRRVFLKKSAAALAGAGALSSPARAKGAGERFAVAVIGCGGRGVNLGRSFQALDDVTVAYVCDPDRKRAAAAQNATGAAQAVTDLRRILDDAAVDGVCISCCDHWHAPAAILACQAGKHVYVEKPCSHNVEEGRQMIEAARRHGRVMQHGTQSRTGVTAQRAIELLRSGIIGDVLIAKCVNSQRRSNIGHAKPASPPEHVDYELWVGPAVWLPYQSNFVHYHWHWFYNFGTGDIGNDGVHGIDIARWGLSVETHPAFVSGYGSKLFFDDDQEFPDTYAITYEYPGDGTVGGKRLLIYEQRIWSPYREDRDGNSLFFYGTEGMLTYGRPGIQVYSRDNELVKEEKRIPMDDAHQRDFIAAVKDGGRRPAADIEIGHLSSTLSHLGNIVSRVGRSVRFDPQTEDIVGDAEARALLSRSYRDGHWATPGA